MNNITRDQLEDKGRSNARVEDQDDYWFSRVLGEYWVAIGKLDDGLSPHINDGFWEPWIMAWVNNNVPRGSIVADLGANVGFYTFQLARTLDCEVDAWEPNPAIFALLKRGLDKNMSEMGLDVNLYQSAVSNVEDELEFIVPRNHPMNGSLHTSVYSPNGEDKIKVKTVNYLDDYDFIKIDIEGGEIDVFEILDPERHPLVLIEFRWDRYDNPLAFAEDIFRKYPNVTFVKNDGREERIDRPGQLEAREHADWMLVLRPGNREE